VCQQEKTIDQLHNWITISGWWSIADIIAATLLVVYKLEPFVV